VPGGIDLRRLAALEAPDLAAIAALADEAYRGLPPEFRALCDDLVIHVEEFPEDDVLDSLGAKSEFEIMGLFQGVGLAADEAVPPTGRLPNAVFLYRRPMLDYWAEHRETLGAVVTHVLIHEIGHHFGLSDADMEAIEARAG
jgi:predicted Zn-dependent protease with MMP-like domain